MATTQEELQERELNTDKICFRFLEENEYWKLVDVYNEYGGDIPNPKLSRVAVAEKDDEIIGFAVFQLIPHAEPFWIREDHRGTNIWVKLASMIEPLTRKKDSYIIATTNEVVKMCEALELERVNHPVYVKRATNG